MSAKIDFLYLSEPDMIKAGVKDMGKCVEVMEDMMVTLKKGDYVMGGENHNSHGCMVTFPDNPEFEGMPKNGEDRRFMAMPAYLGGNFQMAGMKWYGSNKRCSTFHPYDDAQRQRYRRTACTDVGEPSECIQNRCDSRSRS